MAKFPPRLVHRGFLAVALFASVAQSALAQNASPLITGTVSDPRGNPIANALVVIVETHDTVRTQSDGSYSIRSIPNGTYTVQAMFLGFKRVQKDSVRVNARKHVRLDLRLEWNKCDLDCNPVVVPAPSKPPLEPCGLTRA